VGHEDRIDVVHQQAAVAAPQRDDARRVLADLLPGDAALPLRRTAPAAGEQPADVGVTLTVHRQQRQGRVVVEGQLGADNQPDAQLAGLGVGLDHPVDTVAVGERQRVETEMSTGLDELLGMTRPFQEREITFAPQRNIDRHATQKRGRF
jgi:hypothetical protein